MEILKVAGYVRDSGARSCGSARHRRRAFSYEALSDHDSRWLERKLLDDVPEGRISILPQHLESERPASKY